MNKLWKLNWLKVVFIWWEIFKKRGESLWVNISNLGHNFLSYCKNSSCDIVILQTSLYDWWSVYYGKTHWNWQWIHSLCLWVNKTLSEHNDDKKKRFLNVSSFTIQNIQYAKLRLLRALAKKADYLKTLVPNYTIGVSVVPAMNQEVYGQYLWHHTL